MKINTNPQKIDEILFRSVSEIFPSKDKLRKKLLSGDQLKIYIGADPNGKQLHLGHSTNFILLEKLRRLGHKVFVLFGDFTARLGDPTDKLEPRKMLTREEIEKNMKGWKSQISNILKFNGSNSAKIVKNNKWISKMKMEDIINLSSNFTVQQIIKRDIFKQRLKNEKDIYLNEFLYPILQGYDSVVLDVDLEIGGTDQTFNMMIGRTLQKRYNNREKFVITTTLLENPITGKKLMNKSEGNYIGLNDNPKDMFGKTMALPDKIIIQLFIDCTFILLEEIKIIEEKLKLPYINPRDQKMKLAFEIVKIYHGEKKAQEAQEDFINAFQKGGLPKDLPKWLVVSGANSSTEAVRAGLVDSNSKFRRLIKEGGVKDMESGKKITKINFPLNENKIYKVGKHKFWKVVIKK